MIVYLYLNRIDYTIFLDIMYLIFLSGVIIDLRLGSICNDIVV